MTAPRKERKPAVPGSRRTPALLAGISLTALAVVAVLAWSLVGRGDRDQVAAARSGPGWVEYEAGLARAEAGQNAAAIEHFVRAVDQGPGIAAFHHALGGVYLRSGEAAEAENELQRAADLDPRSAATRDLLGRARLAQVEAQLGVKNVDQEMLAGAIDAFEAASRLDPTNADYPLHSGLALHKKHDFDQAAVRFRRAVDLRPGDARAHTLLGLTLFEQGHIAASVAEYRKAVELAPDLAAARIGLATVYEKTRDYEAARRELERAVALDPGNASGWYQLGMILTRLGRREEAARALDEFRRRTRQ